MCIRDSTNAGQAMSNIQNAISMVSEQRSYLGALQHRLEHTIANLDNISENTQSAESVSYTHLDVYKRQDRCCTAFA